MNIQDKINKLYMAQNKINDAIYFIRDSIINTKGQELLEKSCVDPLIISYKRITTIIEMTEQKINIKD